jgi:hypothetical protein
MSFKAYAQEQAPDAAHALPPSLLPEQARRPVAQPEQSGPAATVFRMQRAYGNRVVQRWLKPGTLRRKCGCGAAHTQDEPCAACVARLSAGRGFNGDAEHDEAPGVVHEVLNRPGEPLDAQTRAYAEAQLGQDFSHVRIHRDGLAAESARAVDAAAYTVGRHIVFDAEQYAPQTERGRKLLAHELTHVAQQQGATETGPLQLGDPDSSHEREADRVAEAVAGGGASAAHAPTHTGPSVQRKGLSWELQDAPAAETPEDRVRLWLGKYRPLLEEAEQRFHVDRRAIAGAIAWEALENASTLGFSFRAVGPGKPHLWDVDFTPRLVANEFGMLSLADIKTDMPVKQVEDRGYLPQKSFEQRRELLKSPAGSIQYIGAIMGAIADIAAPVENIRCQPALLADIYQWIDFAKWEARIRQRLESKKKLGTYTPFAIGNKMGAWVQAHLDYLESAVGKPACPLKPPETSQHLLREVDAPK